MVDFVLFASLAHGNNKRCAIVRKDSLGNAEFANDVVSNEVGYYWAAGLLEGYRFDPHCIAFYSSENPNVALRQKVDWITEIEVLSVKWP